MVGTADGPIVGGSEGLKDGRADSVTLAVELIAVVFTVGETVKDDGAMVGVSVTFRVVVAAVG